MVGRRPGPVRFRIPASCTPGVVALLTLLTTCTRDRSPLGPRETPAATVLTGDEPPAILVGAGDIAECATTDDEATATLLDGIPGTVFTAGDNAYPNGSVSDYQNCYGPSWGRHKARTRPAPGNHEYNTPGASGYFNYFGSAAGPAGEGFYSYDLGAWHIIVLNNYIPMETGSEQEQWLRGDLAATTQPCKLAYYHEPLYSSTTGAGSGGTSTPSILPIFTTLYDGGVDVVVNGHRHFYERLAPINPSGQADNARGIREFVVGTGGSETEDPTNAFPRSEVRFGSDNFGVLKFYLYSDSYAWRFVPIPGKTLSDTGSTACHGVPEGISGTRSTLVASPTVITPGGATSTITVAVKDAGGNPISGATVELAATGSGNTLVQPAAVTDADGVATGTLSSSVEEQKVVSATATLAGTTTAIRQTATVTVITLGGGGISHLLLTAGNNTVNQRVYTTAPIAPAPNTLVTVAVLAHRSTGAPASPTLSGGGMTGWTEVASTTFDTGALPLRRLTIFRALSAAPGNGPLTITYSATVSNCQWIVSQWDGVDLNGVNGAGAIVQTGTRQADAVQGLTVSLAQFEKANNVAYGAFGVARNTAVVTPGSGFTEINEQPSGENTPGDLQVERSIGDNTIDANWAVNLNAGAIGFEIRAASSGGAGIVDASQSTMSATPATITAGTATATITVIARDAGGVPVSGANVVLTTSGSGNTLTQPLGPTDANGVATGTLSSTVAETKTVTARANGVTLAQHATVTAQPGSVSATLSSVTASPTTIMPGGQTAAITILVTDNYGNPIRDAAVTLAVSPPAGVALTQPSPTDAGGTAVGTFSSVVPEDKVVSATVIVGATTTPLTRTATVTVTSNAAGITHALLAAGNNAVNTNVYTTASIAPAANALVTVAVLSHRSTGASASPTLSGGGMSSWTVVSSTTFDAGTLPLRRLTIYRAMSASPGSGPITISFANNQSNCQWIVSQWTGVETSGVNGAGAIVQAGSTGGDAVTGLAVPLGPFAKVSNVAYGAFGVNRNVAVVSPGSGFTEISEQASGENTPGDLQAEWQTNDNTVDATWPTNLNGGAAALELNAAAPSSAPIIDASLSTIDASPTDITPGGAGSTIKVTIRDGNGTPVSGVTVEISATGTGNTLPSPGLTNIQGVYTGTFTSTTAEPKVLSATARLGTETTPLTQTAAVVVNPGPVSASASTISADPTTVAAGGETAAITVTVKDGYGNRIPNAAVALSATGTGNVLSAPGVTDANGVYQGTLSSSDPGDKVVSATAQTGDEGTPLHATVTVTVTSGVSALQSTVSAAPATIPAGGGSSTITVAVKDGSGLPISGATVQLAATGTGNTLVQPPNPTGANGEATGTLSSTRAELKTVSATATLAGVTTAITATAGVTVTPGPVSATVSTIAAAPTSIPAGGSSSMITVTVRDADGNPISGAAVQLDATGTGNTIVQPANLTDVNGVTTGALSSTDAGDKVVSASATVGAQTTTLGATVTVSVTPQIVNISQTLLTVGTNTANQRVYTTPAITPTPNTLITIAVLEHSALGTPPVPTLSGGGMAAWEVVATTTFDAGTLPLRRLTIFRAMSAAPGSAPITITSTITLSHVQWIVSQWDGVETSGANGAGAIGQTGSTTGDAASGLTVALAPFGNSHNVGYGAFGVRSTLAAVTPGASFTEIGEQPSGEGTPGDLEAEWAPNISSIAASWTNLNGGALGVEIKARAGP